jgi:hypothetical protein
LTTVAIDANATVTEISPNCTCVKLEAVVRARESWDEELVGVVWVAQWKTWFRLLVRVKFRW